MALRAVDLAMLPTDTAKMTLLPALLIPAVRIWPLDARWSGPQFG
jgi:hypothetical protein